MLIDGLHVPLTDPFYRDGKSYLRKLEHNVARYSLTPAAGLVAFSPGGEAGTLSEEERREAMEAIRESAAAEKVLIAGVAHDSVRRTLAVTEAAYAAQFDAVLLGAPRSWQSLRPKELRLYFAAVADESPLPLLLASGGVHGCTLSVDMLTELARHTNIRGLYDVELTADRRQAITEATLGIAHEVEVTTIFAPVTRRMIASAGKSTGAATFVTAESLSVGTGVAVAPPQPALKTRRRTVGFQLMSTGTVEGLAELLGQGVAGAMPAVAACAPQACHEVYAAFKDGDPALAAEKAERLRDADAVITELGVAAVKYACDLNGYYGGTPRLPRLPLEAAERERVERAFAGLRN